MWEAAQKDDFEVSLLFIYIEIIKMSAVKKLRRQFLYIDDFHLIEGIKVIV